MIRRPRSLAGLLALWFAASLLALYGVAALAIWLYAGVREREYAVLTLKTEVESVVAYVAGTGRLDAPELLAPEEQPIPMWFRVVQDRRVLERTPGIPDLPVAPDTGETVTVSAPPGAGPFVLVRHEVGPSRPGTAVEAVGSLLPIRARQRRLGAGLLAGALLVIPVAALGGRLLSRRALRPLEDLVHEIAGADPERVGRRLSRRPRSVEEVEVLAEAFDGLLGRLEDGMERMRRFTSDASHEIRNPLGVLTTGLEVALRRERDPEEYRALMRENLEEIRRLQAVVEGLLLLGRDAPGREVPLRRESVDLSGLLRETVASFATVAAERGVTIASDVEPGLTADGDPVLLRLVPFNLLDNALKHGPEGRPVHLRAAREDGRLVLEVTDQGPGIAPEVRERLFERYVRAGGGVGGLGLSVVRRVVEAHGGTVRLREGSPGTSLRVELPPGATSASR